jgi:hypothetical protein
MPVIFIDTAAKTSNLEVEEDEASRILLQKFFFLGGP